MKIIIQAGGKGTRLEQLTRNKPKCLVPVDNLPIIFHLFKKFKDCEFTIIADYKIDVLERYLKIFAKDYNYRVIQAKNSGTISGIKEAIANFSSDEPFMLTWCDLILSENFQLPDLSSQSLSKNYIGISKEFECRWSYVDGKFVREPSCENGIAGLFIFKNKQVLKDIEESGAFVRWLSTTDIQFEPLALSGSKEIGTLLSYSDNNKQPQCRPFNKVEIDGDLFIKQPVNEYGEKISVDEIAWYKFIKNLEFENIPTIYNYKPLTMKRVKGKNIYEYDCLTFRQKREILKRIIEALNLLHGLVPSQKANISDLEENYITKTFNRIAIVQNLIPFARDEFIKINNRYYKNVFFLKDELINKIREFYSTEFKLIHGDCTFSNLMFDTFDMKAILIDPRGYFGNTKLYGDEDYDWAKLYYSLVGNYDQFNLKKFTLDIREKDVEFAIKSNGWSDLEESFFEFLPHVNREKIKVLHAIIWISLTTYAWEDYDSICAAFYNGVVKLGEVL